MNADDTQPRGGPWLCRQDGCGRVLGTVVGGSLVPLERPVVISALGVAKFRCRCGRVKLWLPQPTARPHQGSARGLPSNE
jgi:hypothetical protein